MSISLLTILPRVSAISWCTSVLYSFTLLQKIVSIFCRYGIRDSSNISAANPKILMYSFFCYVFIWSFASPIKLRNSTMCSWSVISTVMNFCISSHAMSFVWAAPNFDRVLSRFRLYSNRELFVDRSIVWADACNVKSL